MPVRLLLASVLLAVLAWGPLAAQERGYIFRAITANDGLADNYVLVTLQDRHGYLWIGTRDGLNRYDGYSFTVFKNNPGDSNSIQVGGIDHIIEDPDGNIWIGSSFGGLSRYDGATGHFIHYRHVANNPRSIPGDRVTAIAIDGRGDVWTIAGQLFDNHTRVCRLNRRTGLFDQFDPNLGLTLPPGYDNSHTSLRVDPSGQIWVSTAYAELFRFDVRRQRFVHVMMDRAFTSAESFATTIHMLDSDGSIWARLSDRICVRLVPLGNDHYHCEPAFPSDTSISWNRVTAMYRDRSGMIWIGTMLGGLHTYDPANGRWTHSVRNFYDPCSIASNMIFSITEDNAGNVWLGTDNGLNKVTRLARFFRRFRYDPLDSTGLAGERVRSILYDRDGTLWLGTGGAGLDARLPGASGFRHLRPSRQFHAPAPRNAAHRTQEEIELANHRKSDLDIINTLYQDRAGDLWMGTNGGLIRRDHRTGALTFWTNDPSDSMSIPGTGIWALLEDRSGEFWVGTLRTGLLRMDRATGKFIHYRYDPNNPNGIGSELIHCMMEDRAGNIWIGTENGLDRYDPVTRTFTHFREKPSNSTGGVAALSHDRVWCLLEGSEGSIWVGTSGGGLDRFNPRTQRWRSYTERDGLVNNIVCGILEAEDGALWISTSNGLSRFEPGSERFTNIMSAEGLPIFEFHFKACARIDDGQLIYGGNGGAVMFKPDAIQPNRKPPAVRITTFTLIGSVQPLDTLVDVRRTITLAHDQNFFTIGFAALDLTNPRANQYLYRLEGVDDEWRHADGATPFATYTGVPPGNYRFMVIGSNSNGAWNRDGASIEVIVAPAFWQTSWFRIGIAALAVLMVAWAIRYRIRRIRRDASLERNAVESRLQALQAQMNPHFIFNALNSILHFIVTHDSGSAHRYLTKFSKLIRSILENSRVDLITLAEEVEALRLYLDLESLRFEGVFEYRIDVDPAIDAFTARIPPMLIQPYVENAIKHGLVNRESGGLLTIRMTLEGPVIRCVVEDNGVGRAAAASMNTIRDGSARSMGMELTGERLRMLNEAHRTVFGVQIFDLVDAGGQAAGTRVVISIPAVHRVTYPAIEA